MLARRRRARLLGRGDGRMRHERGCPGDRAHAGHATLLALWGCTARALLAELLLLEPGELSAQSLAQIKTIHTMALRINEVMQRFSTLASEMREVETPSQGETAEAAATLFPRR